MKQKAAEVDQAEQANGKMRGILLDRDLQIESVQVNVLTFYPLSCLINCYLTLVLLGPYIYTVSKLS